MERYIEQYPDDGGGGASKTDEPRPDPRKLEAARKLIELTSKHAQTDEDLDRLTVLAKADGHAFFAELGLTLEEAVQIFSDLGTPIGHDDDEWAGLRAAGHPVNEETVSLYGKPVKAFMDLVVGSEEAAAKIQEDGRYEIDHFVQTMDKLAATAEEQDDFGSFDDLVSFVDLSRNIFPEQYVDLVEALSEAEHALVRGSSSFSLHHVLKLDRQRAIVIWQRLLSDSEPRVLDAAVMNYHFSTRKGGIRTEDGVVPTEKSMSRRDKRALRKHVEAAEGRMRELGYSGLVDWG